MAVLRDAILLMAVLFAGWRSTVYGRSLHMCKQALFGSRVFYSADKNTTIVSKHSLIGEVQMAEVAQFKQRVEDRLFSGWQPREGLTIYLSFDANSFYQATDHSLRVPYDLAATLLRPTDSRMERYFQENPIRFNGAEIFIHELAHSWLIDVFEKAFPGYAKLNSFVRDKQINEKWTDDQFRAFFKEDKHWKKFVRLRTLIDPYEEFLADLAVVLYTNNPESMSRAVYNSIWKAELGSLVSCVSLRQFHDTVTYRSFTKNYGDDLSGHRYNLMVSHAMLGPTRSFVWKHYQKNKSAQDISEYYRRIVGLAVEHLQSRLERNPQLLDTYSAIDFKGPEINLSLIEWIRERFK